MSPNGWSLHRSSVADDGRHEIVDPADLLDLGAVHGTPRAPEGVRFDKNPEEWARAALATFNAPDLVPANVVDTDPWDTPSYEDLTPEFGLVEHGHVHRAASAPTGRWLRTSRA